MATVKQVVISKKKATNKNSKNTSTTSKKHAYTRKVTINGKVRYYYS